MASANAYWNTTTVWRKIFQNKLWLEVTTAVVTDCWVRNCDEAKESSSKTYLP